jgi:hypothetical protein
MMRAQTLLGRLLQTLALAGLPAMASCGDSESTLTGEQSVSAGGTTGGTEGQAGGGSAGAGSPGEGGQSGGAGSSGEGGQSGESGGAGSSGESGVGGAAGAGVIPVAICSSTPMTSCPAQAPGSFMGESCFGPEGVFGIEGAGFGQVILPPLVREPGAPCPSVSGTCEFSYCGGITQFITFAGGPTEKGVECCYPVSMCSPAGIGCGRPLVAEGHQRVASIVRRAGWAAPCTCEPVRPYQERGRSQPAFRPELTV